MYGYYKFFNHPVIMAIRVLSLLGIAVVLVFLFNQTFFFKTLLTFYTFYIISEIAIIFHINRALPNQKVADEGVKPLEAMVFHTRFLFERNFDDLLKDKDVSFVEEKLGGYEPQKIEINKESILEKALQLARDAKGNYITTADIFVAYLLITEDVTHALLEKEITANDLFEILLWCRQDLKSDRRKPVGLHFSGYGVFDFFVYGWDAQTKEYSADLTYAAVSKKQIEISGRDHEYAQMIEVLAKNSVNNVLLVGEVGVGKSTLAMRLAQQSYQDVHFVLNHRKIYELYVDRLLAGVGSSSDLEMRLELLLSEIQHSGNIILFIPNLENIFGGGGFQFDMSGVLFSYLKAGGIQIIGSTTPGYYKSIIRKKESVMNLFEVIRVEEPDRNELFKMLSSHVDLLEEEFGVIISYKAVHESLELSSTYLPDKYLPGKAVNLLQDVCSRARLEGKTVLTKDDVIRVVQEKTHIILERPTQDEKKILLSLEDTLHNRVIGQDEAVTAIAKAIRRLRSGFSQHKRPISVFLFLGPTGVGKTETAKALADIYFGDEKAMVRLDMSEYQTQEEVDRLLGGKVGEEELASSLPEEVRLHPFSLVLLDEFEKAHPHVLDLFLQVFEDGRLTDNQGKTVSFTNTIIIATSNAGSEQIREQVNAGKTTEEFKNGLVEMLLKSGMYRPELLNRFDDVIIFKPLSVEQAGQIAKLILAESLKTLENDQMYLAFDDRVIEKIVKESYDQEAGARNMRRYIGAQVEDFVSKQILEDKLQKGIHAILTVDNDNNFIIQ
ncbi:MAG: AAA family ATPase [Candidatus Levyibacteriota bacterium]